MKDVDSFRDFLRSNGNEAFERLGVYAWHRIEPTPAGDAAVHAELVAGLRRGLVDDGMGDLVDLADLILDRLDAVQSGMRKVMAHNWEAIHGTPPVGCEDPCDLSGTHLERPVGPGTMAGLVMGAVPPEVHASGPAKAAADAARNAGG